MSTQAAAAVIPVIVVIVLLIASTLVARRRGYNVGGKVVVRCLQGHLFTTIWVPGVSLKSIRFGPFRLQRCPVGEHLTFVTPVRDSDLTSEERRMADRFFDTPVP